MKYAAYKVLQYLFLWHLLWKCLYYLLFMDINNNDIKTPDLAVKQLTSHHWHAYMTRLSYISIWVNTPRLITYGGKPLDLIVYIIFNKNMCCLKATQIHKRHFRAVREPGQPSAIQDSFLPHGKKILISHHLSSMKPHGRYAEWDGNINKAKLFAVRQKINLFCQRIHKFFGGLKGPLINLHCLLAAYASFYNDTKTPDPIRLRDIRTWRSYGSYRTTRHSCLSHT